MLGSLRPERGFLPRMISTCDDLKCPSMPLATVIEYDPLLDSSDMGPEVEFGIGTGFEFNQLTWTVN